MTEVQLLKANQLQNRIRRLIEAKVTAHDPAEVAKWSYSYSNISAEFFDAELYNLRVQAAIEAAQKQFDLL